MTSIQFLTRNSTFPNIIFALGYSLPLPFWLLLPFIFYTQLSSSYSFILLFFLSSVYPHFSIFSLLHVRREYLISPIPPLPPPFLSNSFKTQTKTKRSFCLGYICSFPFPLVQFRIQSVIAVNVRLSSLSTERQKLIWP